MKSWMAIISKTRAHDMQFADTFLKYKTSFCLRIKTYVPNNIESTLYLPKAKGINESYIMSFPH